MGYTVVADRFETDQMRTKYGPRDGLEGPFNFSGRVLYYDVKEGAYYDPATDFYVSQAEMDIINTAFMERFKKI
jgi:hypothetical protein